MTYGYQLSGVVCRSTTSKHCIDRNTLQHTATHCNTLQHTATHCNTLQHTATQLDSKFYKVWRSVSLDNIKALYRLYRIYCVAVCCSVLQCVAVCCGRGRLFSKHYIDVTEFAPVQNRPLPLHTATHCNTLQHIATHCNTLQHTATHCNTAMH